MQESRSFTVIFLTVFLALGTTGLAEDDYTTFINGGSVASSLDTLATALDEQADRIAESRCLQGAGSR